MPRIDERTVEGVARLARLRLTPDERARFARELEAILAWAESLQALDTTGVPPMSGPPAATLREDAPRDGLSRDEALAPSGDQADGLFRVPRVLPG
jgi:aspartyl-tRNA(Asn)/glutamyl-tRNA(Gln) amidotransferase subunit C